MKLSLAGSVHDPTDPVGRLLFNVLAMVAESESDLIRLGTRAGIQVRSASSSGSSSALIRATDTGIVPPCHQDMMSGVKAVRVERPPSAPGQGSQSGHRSPADGRRRGRDAGPMLRKRFPDRQQGQARQPTVRNGDDDRLS